ncbi:MAG: dihydrodipicolinate synthase family protein [Armatimonadota bacterium]|nr:MAG: dihydrodipicolinate synthase family protein [Armatimonadota bacterium]
MTPPAGAKTPRPDFRGMMPVMPTPITESGDIDEASQRRLVQYCLKCGAVAVGHLGGASEFYKVGDKDRRRLIEIVVDEVAGRVPVYIGVTATAFRIAVDYAKEAEALGADMLMAGSPYMDVPDRDGMFEYYRGLSDAVSIPIIIQDTAVSSGVLTADVMWQLYQECGNIRYAKVEGQRFLAKMGELLELSGGAMQIIGGAGGRHLIHMLRAGVTAYMTGTEALDIHGAVVSAYLAGDEETAARIYFEQLLPYLMFYQEYPRELLKGMLRDRGVMDCAHVIPPAKVEPMSVLERREFDWVLERIGFNKRWPDIP